MFVSAKQNRPIVCDSTILFTSTYILYFIRDTPLHCTLLIVNWLVLKLVLQIGELFSNYKRCIIKADKCTHVNTDFLSAQPQISGNQTNMLVSLSVGFIWLALFCLLVEEFQLLLIQIFAWSFKNSKLNRHN